MRTNHAKIVMFLGLFFFAFAQPASSQSLHVPLLWKTNLHMLLESAATVADVNADGRAEVLVAGMEKLFVLGEKGQLLWQWRTRKRFCTYPAVLPRGKKPALLYVADNSGLLTCLNGLGRQIWQRELAGPSSWSAAVVYAKPKVGEPRVFQADQTGTVWCFNALNGHILWKTVVSGKPASPALGDLNGDRRPELVVKTGDGSLTALSLAGQQLWRRKIGGTSPDWGTSSPVIFGSADGTARVAVATGDGELIVTDGAGSILWRYPTNQPVASTLSVGDLDQNGVADIFLVTQLGRLFRFDEAGTVLWQIDTQGRSLAPGAILDVTGDGTLNYVLCTQRGHLMIFNPAGTILFEHQFDNRTINVTPAFGNISGKRNTLEFAVTGGESGRVFCFGTPATVHTRKQWTAYRADPQNTGAWFGLTQTTALRMFPQNLRWNQLQIGKPVRFTIVNPRPGRKPLKAVATCTHPDGKRQSAFTWVQGKHGQLSLPVDFVSPGVYRFSWWLEDGHGKKQAAGKKAVAWQLFANDRGLVERAINRLRAVAGTIEHTLPLSARALRQKAADLTAQAARLRPLQEAVPGAASGEISRVLRKTGALNEQAEQALRVADAVLKAKALGPGTSLLAFEGKLWENRNVNKQIPKRAVNPVTISHVVVPGEHQPVSLILLNITNRPLHVQIRVDSIAQGLRVRVLHSVPVPTNLGDTSWDPLPAVGDPGILSIPPLESRELWLDVQIGLHARGIRRMKLKLLALNGAGVFETAANPQTVPPPVTRVTLQLTVLPFHMAPAQDFRLCTWSPSSGSALPDLLSHGNNVFIVPQPKIAADSTGKIQSMDFTVLDSLLKGFRGYDVFLLVSGFPAFPSTFGSTEYRAYLEQYVRGLVVHLAAKGVDGNHFAFYPIDEPGGHGWAAVNKLVHWGKMVHAVDPNVHIYADGGGNVPMLRKMASCVNIWTPPIDWLGQHSPEMRVIRQSGRTLWSYNCSYGYSRPVGANLKNTNLLAEYRNAALFALRHGATGIGFWCYNATPGNLWSRLRLEYNLVYPGQNKPVDSRRWEAVREGIEDARILIALQKFMVKNKDNPRAAWTIKKIRLLFKKDLPALVDPGYQAMKLGLSREAIDASCNEKRLADFRSKIMTCVRSVLALQEK